MEKKLAEKVWQKIGEVAYGDEQIRLKLISGLKAVICKRLTKIEARADSLGRGPLESGKRALNIQPRSGFESVNWISQVYLWLERSKQFI
jgi:hypothetical protein